MQDEIIGENAAVMHGSAPSHTPKGGANTLPGSSGELWDAVAHTRLGTNARAPTADGGGGDRRPGGAAV